MTKEDDASSWLTRLKQFLQTEPRTKDELISLLRDAELRALIDAETLAMIEGVILLAQLKVRDIMLPKNQMVCIEESATLNEIIDIVTESGHSRFPVIDNKQDVIGILHAKDLLNVTQDGSSLFDLNDLIRQATFVPESKRLDILLREFRANRNHMAIVVDEYGLVAGFVTLEDIIEQIIGDIEDEFDIDEEVYIKAHGDSRYILKAQTPIEEFNEEFKADFSDHTYDTIGGIVMTNFGFLPKRGDTITIKDFQFKVLNADARRIKLLECYDLRPNTKGTRESKE